MKGSISKRCGCKEPVLDDGMPVLDARGRPKRRELGASCPRLRRANGTWNPRHGTWGWLYEIPAVPGAKRRHLRKGGYSEEADAEKALEQVHALFNLADTADVPSRAREQIAELIRRTLQESGGLPDLDEVRKRIGAGQRADDEITVEEWLLEWLPTKSDLAPGTLRSYTGHVQQYLIPHLGQIKLHRLRVRQIRDMFEVIKDNNETIRAENMARHALIEALRVARTQRHNRALRRAIKAELAAMPPFRRPAEANTRVRIRATLRSALSDAAVEHDLTHNVAKQLKMSFPKVKPLLWTTSRIEEWRKTGEKPGAVMVWTPLQAAAFLERAKQDEKDLYGLFHLISVLGLRRSEACGLRWSDVDLLHGTIAIRNVIVQLGWETAAKAPKSDAGARTLPVDDTTVKVLRQRQLRQQQHRLAAGDGWVDVGLVFTKANGAPLHPATVSVRFHQISDAAGLPPVGPKGERHGAITRGLKAGIAPKVMSTLAGHSASTFTLDTYTSVLEELEREAVAKLAAVLLSAGANLDAVLA